MRVRALAVSLAAVLILAACGVAEDEVADVGADEAEPDAAATEPADEDPADDEADSDVEATDEAGDTAAGQGLTAVTTVFPLAWIAQQVAPDADVQRVGAQGQDPHDLELTPAERGLFETVDVALYLGPIGFQPQVEQAIEQAADDPVAVSEVVDPSVLLDFDDDHDDHDHGDHADDDHDHGDDDHDDDHDHGDDDHADDDHAGDDHDHGDDEDDHDHGSVDPHVWFNPAAMADVATAVGARFAEADPDGADAYLANAEAVASELTALDAELDEQLTSCTHDTAVVSHEAYAYLLEPRGLDQEGLSGAGGHGAASPQRLAEVIDEIDEQDIPAVLTEPVEGREDAETVASEAGVELLEILSLDLVTEEQETDGYPDLLRAQVAQFAQALECG